MTGEQLRNFPQAFTHVDLINGVLHPPDARSAAIDPNVPLVEISKVRSGWIWLGISRTGRSQRR